MKRENKVLTGHIAAAIDRYENEHPGKLTVGVIVLSLLAVWSSLWRALPKAGEAKLDNTPGGVVKPPRASDVVLA